MKIAISAESACDLPKEVLERYEIYTTPFTVLVGEDLFLDGEKTVPELYSLADKNKTIPKTSAVNEYQFLEHFKKLLDTHDAVVHISMTSTMSCAYQNALSASDKLKNVYVVDSKSLSTGIGLLAIMARLLEKSGADAQKIIEELNVLKEKLQVSLIVNKLDYLRKGGRCSALVCFGANLLQIHPQLILKDGKLTPNKKYRGNFDRCVESYITDTLTEFNNFNKDYVFLTYTTLSENAILKSKEQLKNAGFKNIIECPAGATISSHAGPNAMGVIYINN